MKYVFDGITGEFLFGLQSQLAVNTAFLAFAAMILGKLNEQMNLASLTASLSSSLQLLSPTFWRIQPSIVWCPTLAQASSAWPSLSSNGSSSSPGGASYDSPSESKVGVCLYSAIAFLSSSVASCLECFSIKFTNSRNSPRCLSAFGLVSPGWCV